MTDSTPPTSVWQLKPWWCQPWSIVLTGTVLIASSWLVAHRWWLTLIVALPVGTWMGFFVLVWPRLVTEAGWLEPQADTAQEKN
jgi:hypothetical protein